MTYDGYNRQYNPVSTSETQNNNAYSVRVLRDIQNGIDNFKYYIANYPLINDVYSTNIDGTKIQCLFSEYPSVLEIINVIYPPKWCAAGYNQLVITANHGRLWGTGETTWKLYATDTFTNIDIEIFDSSKYQKYDVCSWTTDSDTKSITVSTMDLNTRTPAGYIWFVLTSQNDNADTRSCLYSISVRPRIK